MNGSRQMAVMLSASSKQPAQANFIYFFLQEIITGCEKKSIPENGFKAKP
jgi:hypothetical protein